MQKLKATSRDIRPVAPQSTKSQRRLKERKKSM
jgi:hypothetical protein